MQFSQVKGQYEIKQKLVSIVTQGHFPHALLIYGKDGYGNLALALALAQYISCTDKQPNGDSCGQCPSCKKYMKLIHPDLHLIFPNTTTDKITKENSSSQYLSEFRKFVVDNQGYGTLFDWEEFMGSGNKQGIINVRDANDIVNTLSIKSYESKYKIMIIWNADKMNTEAANKILKILEEPYPDTVFILTTENKDRIMPTIISRVQQVKLLPLEPEIMAEQIKEKYNDISQQEIEVKISQCEGNFSRLKEIDSEKELEKQQLFMAVNRYAMMYNRKASDILAFTDVFSKKTREEIKTFLSYYSYMIEKCWLYNNNVNMYANPLEVMEPNFKNNFPKFITNNNIQKIYELIEKTMKNVDSNANAKINIFDMIIKLGMLLEKH